MFITKLKKYSSIIFAILITTNYAHSKSQNDLVRPSINEEQDREHLHKEKDLMLAFFDIVHESIKDDEKLKKKMEEIIGTHMYSIKNKDIVAVMKFLDGDNKSKLQSLAEHIKKVFNHPTALQSFRTILVKIVQKIHKTPEMIAAINKFLQDISQKPVTYKKLLAAEKSYSMEHKEQKDIINAKNSNTVLAIITKIFNEYMVSNHNLTK